MELDNDPRWGSVPADDEEDPEPHLDVVLGPKLYEEARNGFCVTDWWLTEPEHDHDPYWWQKKSGREMYRKVVCEQLYRQSVVTRWNALPRETIAAAPCGPYAPWLKPSVMDHWAEYFAAQDAEYFAAQDAEY